MRCDRGRPASGRSEGGSQRTVPPGDGRELRALFFWWQRCNSSPACAPTPQPGGPRYFSPQHSGQCYCGRRQHAPKVAQRCQNGVAHPVPRDHGKKNRKRLAHAPTIYRRCRVAVRLFMGIEYVLGVGRGTGSTFVLLSRLSSLLCPPSLFAGEDRCHHTISIKFRQRTRWPCTHPLCRRSRSGPSRGRPGACSRSRGPRSSGRWDGWRHTRCGRRGQQRHRKRGRRRKTRRGPTGAARASAGSGEGRGWWEGWEV